MSRQRTRAAARAVNAESPGEIGDNQPPDTDWLYCLEMVDCGKSASGRCRKCANGPGHGPYWYRYRWYDGKMHKRYVGKTVPQQYMRSVSPQHDH